MSPAARSPWSRVLAVGILIVLAAAVITLVIAPLWRMSQGYDQAIADLERRLTAERRIAGGAAALESRLRDLEKGFARDGHYLMSTTQTLAAAEIQEVVKRAILSKRGEILSSQITGVEQEGGAQRVILAVTLRAHLEQVVQILHLLETSDPFFFIDTASFRARVTPVRGRLPTGALPAAQPLDVQLQLSGYFTEGPT